MGGKNSLDGKARKTKNEKIISDEKKPSRKKHIFSHLTINFTLRDW